MAGPAPQNRKVLAALRTATAAMSPALARIGMHVLDHPDASLALTVTELAEAAATSEASVIRFCRELEFDSFQGFKLALATELAGRPSQTGAATAAWPALQAITDGAIGAARETADLLDRETMAIAVARLLGARRIALAGFGASAVTADYLNYKLTRLGLASAVHADPHMAAMVAAAMDSSDALVLISSSGSTLDAVRVATLARERGAFVVAVTNRARSPLSAVADTTLVAAAPETPLTGGAFTAKIGQFMVVELIYASLQDASPAAGSAVAATAGSVTDRGY